VTAWVERQIDPMPGRNPSTVQAERRAADRVARGLAPDGGPLFRRAPWMRFGACVGMPTDEFYPERGAMDQVEQARAVCADCPVKWQCLDYAIAMTDRNGIWGGKSERERRAIRGGHSPLSRKAVTINARAEARYLPEDVWQAKEGA